MWSECRCERTTKSSVLRSTPFAFTLAAKMSASFPVSNKCVSPRDLYEGREAPVLGHRRIGSECIVEDSDLVFGLAVAALAGAAIEMRLESPAAIRTVARSFMRVPPYERTIIEIAFCRRAISSIFEAPPRLARKPEPEKSRWVFFSGVEVRTAPRYALSLELSIIVRLTAAVLDDVFHVRTADV